MNKKDLAVYLGSMITYKRKEMERVVGDKPNKRHHFTKYIPLWTRGEVTFSLLGGLCATNHISTERQRRDDTLLWPLCTVSNDTVHKGFRLSHQRHYLVPTQYSQEKVLSLASVSGNTHRS
jgi:hypothetical protein